MKLDYAAKILNHLGEAIKADEDKDLTLKAAIFALGSIQYQGQQPDEKAKIGEACWKVVAGDELSSEHITALKNCAKQVYNPIVLTSIVKALEGGSASA